jgi:hypothetical protein
LLALGINTHFYPLDFNNDCDCPTLLKNGNPFKKGLFISIKPGVHYNFHNVDERSKSGSLSPALGVGIGLDMGISNRLSLSPFMQYDWHHNTDWENIPNTNLSHIIGPAIFEYYNPDSPTYKQFKLGIRIGFRSEKK